VSDHELVEPSEQGASWRCLGCCQACASGNLCDCCDDDVHELAALLAPGWAEGCE